MASTIKLKSGSGAPLSSDLVEAEVAIDMTNKRLYTENSAGTVLELGINPSSLTIGGTALTATAAELNTLDGITATTAELNTLDGITATVTELNYTDGVTSNIQTQLNTKAPIASPTFTGTVTAPAVNVNGTVTADGLTVDGDALITGNGTTDQLTINNNATGSTASPQYADVTFNGYSTYNRARIRGVDRASNTVLGGLIIQTGSSNTTIEDRIFVDGNGDISFYEDTGTTAKFFWDASTERLGIGTSSPSALLNVQRNGTAVSGLDSATAATFQSTGASGSSTHVNILAGSTGSNGQALLTFGDSDDPDIGRITYRNGDNSMAFTTNTSEAMRIDSSGNLLVGKTSASLGTAGIELKPDGIVRSTRNGYVAEFNRITTDGEIVNLKAAGTTVGSIGARGGDMFFTAATVGGLRPYAAGSAIIPCSTAGSGLDATLDLASAAWRFKDLYLSGGVYLGGTGAANQLDDYETGTFTPVIADASTGGNTGTAGTLQGNYVKIGNLVTVRMFIANVDTTGLTSTNALVIRNLPFANYNAPNQMVSVGSCRLDQITFSGNYVTPEVNGAGNYLVFKETVSANQDVGVLVSSVNSGSSDIFLTLTYQTLE